MAEAFELIPKVETSYLFLSEGKAHRLTPSAVVEIVDVEGIIDGMLNIVKTKILNAGGGMWCA